MAIREWKKEKTDLVQQAVDEEFGKSRQAYMIEAIKAALAANRIPEWKDEGAETAEKQSAEKKESA